MKGGHQKVLVVVHKKKAVTFFGMFGLAYYFRRVNNDLFSWKGSSWPHFF
jgi:hypothetical protein